MSIQFECEHCRRELEAEDAMGGDVVECPYCKGTVTVPNPAARDYQQKSFVHQTLRLSDPIPKGQRVVLVGVDMTFSAIFAFAIKFALAFLLLGLILGVIYQAFVTLIGPW